LNIDIFQLLIETAEKKRKKKREELLLALGIKEFFSEGNISIDKRTCKGIECKLCIKSCPTNALFWKSGEIGIIEDLCIFCGACVLNCIVDNCIKVKRKRLSNEIEVFSKPQDFITLQSIINTKKRFNRAKAIFPTQEAYLKKYRLATQ